MIGSEAPALGKQEISDLGQLSKARIWKASEQCSGEEAYKSFIKSTDERDGLTRSNRSLGHHVPHAAHTLARYTANDTLPAPDTACLDTHMHKTAIGAWETLGPRVIDGIDRIHDTAK